ncbi:ferritin [Candidatus Palibaumannia cicadellinicola]|uniref:Ferritin n=1 Tax=Candidatus Palibaumannia cicadellinicola TaxID=186490 RepID=A0A0K2BLC1_9GAMM|nr:ferritin [Candidatus Baumannia cicadellinicola]AKZ65853.1 Ferritin-like protein 2 [Candidatus Baumannia cicadellinicola]
MVQSEVTTKLNEQLNLECYSANFYLQISAWCHQKKIENFSKFFQKQSKEEIQHIHRIFEYLNDIGKMPILSVINAPPVDFSSLTELIYMAYEHEKNITNKINSLAQTAITLNDYSTFYFLQWYIAQQQKEEKIFKSIKNQLDLVTLDYNGLLLIDQLIKNQY